MSIEDKINNAKKNFSDSKSRVAIIILVVVVIFAVMFAYFKLRNGASGSSGASVIGRVPSISSIPGLVQPTREYAKLQNQENIALAKEAARKGIAAIPTVVRPTYADEGITLDLSKGSGVTSVAGCDIEDLRKARESGVTASELRCRGCSLAALKAAGFSAADLRDAGFSAADLKAAGFISDELKAAGSSVTELVNAGFGPKELIVAGFTTGELKSAGFSTADDKITASSSGSCSVEALQAARIKGTSAVDLKKMGCSAAAMRAAGFSAAELKAAGFSAAELKAAGFSAADLRAAGFSAKDLRDAGFSAKDLLNAGFSVKELKDAGFSAGELRAAGVSAADLKDAGFSAAELKAAGFSAAELKAIGFDSADELKKAGFSSGDLVRAGVSAPVLSNSKPVVVMSCSVDSLKSSLNAGMNVAEAKKMGCSLDVLKAAGFSVEEPAVKASAVDVPNQPDCSVAGINKSRAEGVTLVQLKDKGCSVTEIKIALLRDNDTNKSGLSDSQINNLTSSDLDNLQRQLEARMKQQASDLFQQWAIIPNQQYVAGSENDLKGSGSDNNAKAGAETKVDKDVTYYKAGTIFFALLDSAVNSDENAPVLATIIHGPLAKSKLLGSFQRVDKKLLIKFSVLSVPNLTNSISINAVAIDPNTAGTAMASSVDNHYLLRYGSAFATAFLSGLGSAVQNAGSTTTTSATTGTTSTLGKLDFMQQVLVGLGSVGQSMSSMSGGLQNTPPTIKVKAGTNMGLLIMSDLAVPKGDKKD